MGRRGAVLIALGGVAVTSAVAIAIAARPEPIELPPVRTTWGVPPPSLVPPSAPGDHNVEFQRYLGGLFASEAFDTVRYAERVETLEVRDLIVDPDPSLRPTPAELQAGFVILPRATPVPPALAREIVRAILDPAVYREGIGCLFQPGVAIRFHKGSRIVDAIVCFQCGDLEFQPLGETRMILGRIGFDEAPLLDLVRRARPGDARFAQLK